MLKGQIKNRINPNLTFILLFALFQSILPHIAVSQCYNKNAALKAGEKLWYNAYYNFGFIKIKLANIKLWIDESSYNKDVYVLQNTTKTLPEYEWVIKVKDYYASYMDINSMKPERHIQKTLVNKYQTNYDYKFDYQEKKVYASIENSKMPLHMDTLNLKPCLHDLLSAAYYPRNIDYSKLTIGEKISLPVILDTKIYQIYFKYMGTETIITKNKKKLSCVKITPLLVETSIFTGGEKMTVWLSNDKNKIPVMMESELWIGKIRVWIEKYEGLRYPATY